MGDSLFIGTIRRMYLGPQVASFVERFIILFLYLGESTVGSSIVLQEKNDFHESTTCMYIRLQWSVL